MDLHTRTRNSLTRGELAEIFDRMEDRNFHGNKIRIVMYNGQKWLVFADICKALGYKNPNHEAKRLLPQEKCRIDIGLRNTLAVCINEAGVHALRLFSSKSETNEFLAWASSEIFN